MLNEIIEDTKFRLSQPHEREIQGFKMWINTKEPSYIFRKTLRYYDTTESHEPSTTALFKKIVKPGDTVVDIGANMGYFSMLAKRLGADKVYSYEPDPKSYSYLVKNAKINNYDITARSCAISNVSGREKLFLCPYDSGHHTLKQNNGITEYRKETSLIRKLFLSQKRHIEIFTKRLDDEIAGRVDVIKMDCEGSELLALKGMERILEDSPKMIIEFFPLLLEKMGSDPKGLIQRLLNYSVYIIPNDYNAEGGIEINSYEGLMGHLKGREDHLNLFINYDR